MRHLVRWSLLSLFAVLPALQSAAVCPAAPPTLNSPSNNATVPFGHINLDWSPVAGAQAYKGYLALDGDTPTPVFEQAGTTKGILVEPGRTVEWFIVAKANACADQVSSTFTFTTTCPSGAPSATSPANGATFPEGTSITFKWAPFAGATSYDLKVNNGEEWQILGENLTVTQFTATLPQGDYLWEVRGNFDGDCEPAYSTPRELVVGPNCTGNTAVTLLAPADNATTGVPVKFEWSERANAEGYTLYVLRNGNFVPRALTQTQNTEYTTDELTPGTYEWWVQVNYDNCADAESRRNTLTVTGDGGDDCPEQPQKAQLLTPPAGATNLTSPVTFTWQAVPRAAGYRVLAAFDNGEPSSIGATTSTSLSVSLPAGSGLWAVQTIFGDECPTTLSDPRAFTVSSGTPCNNAPPQLVAPANGATVEGQQVTFDWNPVAGARRYRLFVATGDDPMEFYGETEETAVQRFVPVGTVRWFVVATFAVCDNVQSATSTFTVSSPPACPFGRLDVVAPVNGATVTSPVRFAWNALQGALAYRVWLSIDGSAPVPITRTTSSEATVSLPAGNMRFYVEALREGCDPVVSVTTPFTVAQAANCGNDLPPVLVSPVGPRTNPAQVDDDVVLDWNPVERAIGYRIWLGREGEGFSDVAFTLDTSYELEIPEDGLYGWFVQALFEGCAPVASAPAFFLVDDTEERCHGLAPSPVSPAEGSTSTSPVTFVWTAVDEAEKYRIFASRNGEEPRLIGTTDQTELTIPLPPGAYVWSVESSFEACPSTMSPRAHFTIPQAQNCSTTGAELVSPPNGATNVLAPVDFVWSPVSGAVKYVLVARVNDGAPTAFALTTETHFLVEKVPPGTIEWWVVTYFAGCEPADSAHFRFTVERAQNCDNRRPILLIPTGNVTSPVHFQWAGVPRATGYKLWLAQGEQSASVAVSTEATEAEVTLSPGRYEYFVEALFASCPSTESARGEFNVIAPVACGTPTAPDAQVVGQALSNTPYRLRWTPLPNVGLYEVQESTSPDFTNAQTFTTSDTSLRFEHEVTGTPVQYLYRVRGVSDCNDRRGPYSKRVGVFVTPVRTNNSSTEVGAEGTVVQTLFLPGSTEPLTFVATVDKPWLTVSPSSGVLPVEGLTLTVTADPSVLNLGTNTGTVKITYNTASGKGPATNATTLTTIPVSVSLVTPVSPAGSGTPPPDALIFPVVGHAQGANDSLFESDIRITNLTAKTMKYSLNFTPSGTDGTQTGSQSTIEIAPGSTLALDDVVASLFGIGTTSSAIGMLEVRPMTTTSSASSSLVSQVTPGLLKYLDSAGSSRTYNFTPTGTFGQFIPAVRFGDFVGRALNGELPKILSLQQVSQSAAYRANFGFAEAAGQPADLQVRVYDIANNLLKTIPVSLRPREHTQINGMLAANGITDLADGRVEVEVIGGGGKVTAYVSEVDNLTNDPLLVSPVVKGAITSNRYVVPGVAYIQSDSVFWVTDLRVFNAGTAETPATITFYPQGNPSGFVTRDITLAAGEIKVLDNLIGDLFAQPNGAGGMVAITTPGNTNLTASARTYNKTSNGTYGQYIAGVTPAESVGATDRPLQLLQLEQSSRFRTNIGLAETTGQPVTVEVSAIAPDTNTTPVVQFTMQPNEFRQFSLGSFGLGDVYNARVAIKVVAGTGRVTGYGSAIDQQTQDPTYVPAQ
ncbi:MAG TPA: hypothetical protein VE974_20610 [Thermoanaerobaculia bacterium]|nr:hypothetical protein [Thermoanaerobaculia bacterium]